MAWTLLGRVAQALAQAGLLVVAARIGGAEMVGELALALAICSPVMVVVGLQQRVVFVTDVGRRFGWRTHVQLRRVASAVGIVAALLLASTPWISAPLATVAALSLAKAGDLRGDLHHATYQVRRAMRLYARSLWLRAGMGLVAMAVFTAVTRELSLGLLAMAAVSWAVAVLHDGPTSVALRGPPAGGGDWVALLQTAAPLGLVMLVDSLTQQAVRLQVDGMLGASALGHYAVMSYVGVAGGAVVFSLGTPLLRPMAEHFGAGRRRAFVRIVLRLVGLCATLGLGGVAFAVTLGRPFLGAVFGVEFETHADVFGTVMGAAALHFVLNALMHAVNATGQRRAQPVVYWVALGATVVSGWSWIPAHGLTGAAAAASAGWAAAVVVAAILLVHAVRRGAPA